MHPSPRNPYAPSATVADQVVVPRVPQYCLGNSLLIAASFPYLVFVSSAIYFGAEFVQANAGSLTLLFLLGSTGMGLAIFARTRWHWFSPVFLWSAGSCLACWMLLLYLPDYPLGGMVIRAVWIMLLASLCVPFSFHRQTRFAQQSPGRDAACSEMNCGGRLGRSIRTADFRYSEWRNVKNDLVASELHDHRRDTVPGQLETDNVVDDPTLSDAVTRLSRRLHRLVPHDVKVEN